ncbi:acid phosphatase/Vanadium-dependent haloperoxidase [Whalleya microplaca]|nr:acid phosphatase/Vanadium-dependent haloperoxidase [Whalleya microplaca]
MGIFSKSQKERRDPTQQHASTTKKPETWRQHLHSEAYSMETRPTFAQWLKLTWPDIITMLILGGIAIGVHRLGPVATRTFPLTVPSTITGDTTNEVVYPQFAYPYRSYIIPSELDAALALVVPIIFILLAQIRIRNFWDTNNAIIGLIYAAETASAFHVMIKWLVGGLRPNFYDVCRPDATGLNGIGYQQYMFTSEVCTNTDKAKLWDAMQSFPSGHSTTVFAGYVFLYLYLNAKLKVFANYHPSMWKLVLLYCPILGAVLVCGVLTVDQSHNWYDIVAGALIGTMFAFSGYRMVYASIWDWRINHIPLSRRTAFVWDGGCQDSNLVFTDRAGWRPVRSGKEAETLPLPVTSDGHTKGQSSARYDGYIDGGRSGPNYASSPSSRELLDPARRSRMQDGDIV